jgi:hypothetical protein
VVTARLSENSSRSRWVWRGGAIFSLALSLLYCQITLLWHTSPSNPISIGDKHDGWTFSRSSGWTSNTCQGRKTLLTTCHACQVWKVCRRCSYVVCHLHVVCRTLMTCKWIRSRQILIICVVLSHFLKRTRFWTVFATVSRRALCLGSCRSFSKHNVVRVLLLSVMVFYANWCVILIAQLCQLMTRRWYRSF